MRDYNEHIAWIKIGKNMRKVQMMKLNETGDNELLIKEDKGEMNMNGII